MSTWTQKHMATEIMAQGAKLGPCGGESNSSVTLSCKWMLIANKCKGRLDTDSAQCLPQAHATSLRTVINGAQGPSYTPEPCRYLPINNCLQCILYVQANAYLLTYNTVLAAGWCDP